MPKAWTKFLNPNHNELLQWFRSEEAGDLQFDALHPVAREALTSFEDEFADPFPRIESHGSYIFGLLAAPTSVVDDRSDFFTVLFLANFDQIVTVLRVAPGGPSTGSNFDITAIDQEIARASKLPDHPDWSVGMAIATIADIFVSAIEKSLDKLKSNVLIDLELVTSESRQIPSNADSAYLSELYRRTAVNKTEVVSLRTILQETKNVFKAVSSDEVDVRRRAADINEDLFPPYVEVSITDLLMRTRHLTSIRNNLESDLELMFKRFQEIQNSQQTAVGRKFTGVLSILLLPQLIAGFFGQNFESTPGYQDELGWLYSLALMAVVSVVQFYWFRKRKYL
jgi:Mg2+ and Co2+ transporter CorA